MMLVGIDPISRRLIPVRPKPDYRWLRFRLNCANSRLGTLFGDDMGMESSLVPIDRIERNILFIRGEKVMLDSDLAELYGVTTKALNQAVKRNLSRFPDDFMLVLSLAEGNSLRSQIEAVSQSVQREPVSRSKARFEPRASCH